MAGSGAVAEVTLGLHKVRIYSENKQRGGWSVGGEVGTKERKNLI